MDGMRTTPEVMAKAAGDVRTAQQNVQSELTSLRGKMEMVRGAWGGTAATTFTALMTRWDTNARTLNDALASIGDAVQTSGVTYQAQEDEANRQLSTISAALG